MEKESLRRLSPLILALDTSDLDEARRIASSVRGQVDIVKIGLQLFSSAGPDAVKTFKDEGFEVFVDIKMCDIPNTVASACRVLCTLEPLMLTLHTMGGREMMKAALAAVRDCCEDSRLRRPMLLGVTVLTSIDVLGLERIGIEDSIGDQVCRLAALARDSGMDGLVCSPLEILPVRHDVGDEMVLVTPGVRLSDSSLHDQKRVATPKKAIQSGADFLVIGRPIYASEDPARSACEIMESLER